MIWGRIWLMQAAIARPHHAYTHLVALVTSPSTNHLKTVHHDAVSVLVRLHRIYISDIVTPVTHLPGRAQLRSAKNGDYNCPRVLSGFGRRSFSVSGPDAWNSLPRQLRGITVASTFEGQSMFWPMKMSHSFIQNCCCLQVSQHPGWIVGHYHFTDLAYLMLTILPSLRLISSKETCPPINVFAAPLGLSHHDPRQNSKTWAQVTRRRKSS